MKRRNGTGSPPCAREGLRAEAGPVALQGARECGDKFALQCQSTEKERSIFGSLLSITTYSARRSRPLVGHSYGPLVIYLPRRFRLLPPRPSDELVRPAPLGASCAA